MLDKVFELFKTIDKRFTNIPYLYCKLGVLGLGVILFLIMLRLNIMTPMWVDDFDYTYNYKTLDKIHSIKDIVDSQYVHYFAWGGRVVAHFIAHLLLMLPALVADILNALVFVLFIYLIYLHIKGLKGGHSSSLFLFVFIITWFTQSAMGETTLWITGSANYLWCTSIVLLILLPYRLYFEENSSVKCKGVVVLTSLLMFISGVIAGWTNENIGIALCLMVFIFVFLKYKETKRISMWRLAGLLGVVIGYIMLVAAPGNYIRGQSYQVDYSWFTFFYRFMLCSSRYLYSVGSLIIISIILLVLIFKFSNLDRKKLLSLLSIYLLGSLIALYAMLAAPVFPARAMFGIVVFFTIFFGIICYSSVKTLSFIRYIKYVIMLLICFAFSVDFYFSYKGLNVINQKWNEREKNILDAKKKKKSVVNIELINIPTKFEIGDHTFCLKNMSKYYEIDIHVQDRT